MLRKIVIATIAALSACAAQAQSPIKSFPPGTFSNQAAIGGSAAFDPLSLSPFVYYQVNRSTLYQSNACSGTQATADGDPVGCITDLGSAGFNLVSVADDTTRPTYHTNSGKPYITFDGSNDCLRSLNTLGLYSAGTAGYVLAFASSSATPTAGQRPIFEGANASNPFGGWMDSTGSASLATWLFRNDSGAGIGTSPNLASSYTGANAVFGISWDGSNGTPYLAGSAGASRALAAGSTFNGTRFSLGCAWRNTAGSWFAGNIQAFFAKKATLSAGDMTSLNTYFSGIQ